MGLFTILELIFVVLKLTGYVDWSWWLVLAPLFADIIISTLIVAFGVSICMGD